MPRHTYIGTIIPATREHNYVETRISFNDYMKSPKKDKFHKPVMQTSLQDERVVAMVQEYISKPYLFRCKDKIVIADLNDDWFVIDGQHRLSMIEDLYNIHKKYEDSHKFTLCWFKPKTFYELENVFHAINMDSCKNKFYINQDIKDRIKINDFTRDFKTRYAQYFSKTKSTSAKSNIYAIEEFRDELIKNDFFKDDKCSDELIIHLKEQNDKYWEINRYDVNLINNSQLFYTIELSKMKDNIIFGLKRNNFIEWLFDNTIVPSHKFRQYKKKISKKIRNQVWKKYNHDDFTAICPMDDCKNELVRDEEWQCGHLIAENMGGETSLDNLRPICKSCNIDMGTQSWKDYTNNLKK